MLNNNNNNNDNDNENNNNSNNNIIINNNNNATMNMLINKSLSEFLLVQFSAVGVCLCRYIVTVLIGWQKLQPVTQ